MRCEIHDVHLWRARTQELAADAGELAATLSPDEQQRAQGFALRKDREAFILRRGLLRAILSQYLPEGPDEIRFRHGYFGKPHLDLGSHRPGLYFNLSHRMGLVLCALGRGGPLGVDVEFLAPMRQLSSCQATSRLPSPPCRQQRGCWPSTFGGPGRRRTSRLRATV